jgi:hypothetical protein
MAEGVITLMADPKPGMLHAVRGRRKKAGGLS